MKKTVDEEKSKCKWQMDTTTDQDHPYIEKKVVNGPFSSNWIQGQDATDKHLGDCPRHPLASREIKPLFDRSSRNKKTNQILTANIIDNAAAEVSADVNTRDDGDGGGAYGGKIIPIAEILKKLNIGCSSNTCNTSTPTITSSATDNRAHDDNSSTTYIPVAVKVEDGCSHHTNNPHHSSPKRSPTKAHQVTFALRYASICSKCSRALPVGTVAAGTMIDKKWKFLCVPDCLPAPSPAHKEETLIRRQYDNRTPNKKKNDTAIVEDASSVNSEENDSAPIVLKIDINRRATTNKNPICINLNITE